MKVGMKLDLEGIKSGVLAHGEKVAFAVVIVAVLLFTYSAVSREVLDGSKQPEDLRSLAASVGQHVDGSPWDAQREGVQVVKYTERAVSQPVDGAAFALPTLFDPPVVDQKAKREDPQVFAVEDLRVGSGYDVFLLKGEGAADARDAQASKGKLQAQPWAVVTGLVPIARQREEYERAFGQALGTDKSRDVPQYFAPKLECAEIDESQGEKVEWKVVEDADFEETWAGRGKEIVAKKYLDEQLTAPLGELANRDQNWGEVVGHPKIPLEGEEVAARNANAQPPNRPGRPAAAAGDDQAASDQVEYLLLRAFDYSVKSGKKYRYRVTLELANPNFKQPPQYLKNPASGTKSTLTSEPSEATRIVSIPDGHRVLAGRVEGGGRYSEPSATILVTAIEPQEGLEAAIELREVQRGQLANTRRPETVKVKHPVNNQVTDVTMGFKSDILVLDIFGGRQLGRRRNPPIVSPGEILLLDPEGKMIVRNELDDRAQYESSLVEVPAAPEPKRGPLLEDDKRRRQRRR